MICHEHDRDAHVQNGVMFLATHEQFIFSSWQFKIIDFGCNFAIADGITPTVNETDFLYPS